MHDVRHKSVLSYGYNDSYSFVVEFLQLDGGCGW
jgi:hypothetical protein